MTRLEKYRPFQKYIAVGCIIISVLNYMLHNIPMAYMHLILGLFLLLTSSQKIEDERSASLRVKSMYGALVIAYSIKMLISLLYDQQIISFKLTDIDPFFVMVLCMANIFYYVRLYTGRL
jgi:hypothetical protein